MTVILHQIIAQVPTLKGRAQKAITQVHHLNQKAGLFDGIERTYRPIDDDGQQLPSESKNIQFTTEDMINATRSSIGNLFDAVRAQDEGNALATADVVVDNEVLLTGVPVTHLLFLEKQLKDLETMIQGIPTLDPSIEWDFDDSSGHYRSAPYDTIKTRKVEKPIVLYGATDKHPAQT